MNQTLSFGEYVRRQRKEKRINLLALAELSGASYSHLSRIESDSTLPNAATVAKLAHALDGDLKLMLELANCLPRTILDRIEATPSQGQALHRSVYQESGDEVPSVLSTPVAQFALASGLDERDASEIHDAVRVLCELPDDRRKSLIALIRSLSPEAGNEHV